MKSLSATIRLRPVRIALLVRPNDAASIRKFIRSCACLWGGTYNPIIPVFRRTPLIWRDNSRLQTSPRDVTRGYIKYFEPDVYIEAQKGLLEEAGLSEFRQNSVGDKRVVALNKFIAAREGKNWAEPAAGLAITEALFEIFNEEQRFQLKYPDPAITVSTKQSSFLTEAVFGVYPEGKPFKHFQRNFEEIYKPEAMKPNAEAWKKVFAEGAITPLKLTRYKLDAQRGWFHDPIIFVFDPTNPLDIIDLWNIKLDPHPILPLPLEW